MIEMHDNEHGKNLIIVLSLKKKKKKLKIQDKITPMAFEQVLYFSIENFEHI